MKLLDAFSTSAVSNQCISHHLIKNRNTACIPIYINLFFNFPVAMLFSSCLSFLLLLKIFHFLSSLDCIIFATSHLNSEKSGKASFTLGGINTPRELYRTPYGHELSDIPPSKVERLSTKHEVRTHTNSRKHLTGAANS